MENNQKFSMFPQDIIDEVLSKYPDSNDSEKFHLMEMKLNTKRQIEARNSKKDEDETITKKGDFESVKYNPPVSEVVEPMVETKPRKEINVDSISMPDMDQPFDLIPLPSGGKTYPGKRDKIKVAYMNASDESIMTSPNLIQSGEFLEVLFNRKILDQSIRYNDLLPGDRNAIMIWLRATAYGEQYPIQVLDNNDEYFEHVVNLSELKTITLDKDADLNGCFEYSLESNGDVIKFKLLTVGDIDDITKLVQKDIDSDELLHNELLYTLNKEIVSINGNKDREYIKKYVNYIRSSDLKGYREFVNGLESGIDLTLSIKAPGGELIDTFLPFAQNFFWSNS